MNEEDLKKVRGFAIENDKGVFRIRYRTLDGKLHRLPPTMHPEFGNKEEAQLWVKTKSAFISGEKSRVRKIKQNNDKWPHIQDQLKLYIQYKKEGKLKDWKTIEAYFQNYVFNFFLSTMQTNNVAEWPIHYDEFLKHLDNTKSKKNSSLAVETQRKIAFYFNDFLEFLFKKKHSAINIEKLEVPDAKDSELSAEEAYWTENDIEKVKPYLSEDVRNIFIFGLETGMRVGEMLGIGIDQYHKGDLNNKDLDKGLRSNGIEYKGYLKLEGQLNRIENGQYTLKPLKGKDDMKTAYSRYIPVTLKCFEIVKFYNNRIRLIPNLPTNDSRNLFWPDLNQAQINKEIQEACKKAGVYVKTTHSTRHTFCTNFLMKTLSEFLTKLISGHTSEKAFKRYIHLKDSLLDSRTKNDGML